MDPRFTDETLAFSRLMLQNAAAKAGSPTVESIRDMLDQLHAGLNSTFHEKFNGTITEQIIKTNSTDIPISIHTPVDVNKDKLGIFFHGGGFTAGSIKTHRVATNYLAETTNFTWISVEYRLAPEHKFPIWLDDATEATEYIIKNKSIFGASENAKVGVAGDSAGGMIAASVAHAINGLDFQILIYAALDIVGKTASQKEFTEPQYFLTPELMTWFRSQAFKSPEDYLNSRVSVLLNTSFNNVPPCLFIVADLDILRDGNLEYKKLLDNAGVKTELLLLKGTVHGFFSLPGAFPQSCATSMEAVKKFLATI